MKILKIYIDGLQKFSDNSFEIEFEPHKFVRRSSITNDINEVLPELYLGNIFCVCGLYGSGKSSTISVINDSYNLVKEVLCNNISEYQLGDVLYKKDVTFDIHLLIGEVLCNVNVKLCNNIITDTKFYKKKYLKSYYVNDYLYEFESSDEVDFIYLEKSEEVIKIEDIKNIVYSYDNNIVDIDDEYIYYEDYNLKICSDSTIPNLYRLLKNIRSILNSGEVLIIDDLDIQIEGYLLEGILEMFMNDRINRNYSTLIFSTKNFQSVDLIKRIDNIYYTYNNGYLNVDNLSKYIKRNEVRKSSFLISKWEERNINISEVLNGSN